MLTQLVSLFRFSSSPFLFSLEDGPHRDLGPADSGMPLGEGPNESFKSERLVKVMKDLENWSHLKESATMDEVKEEA